MTSRTTQGRWVHVLGIAIVGASGILAVAVSAFTAESSPGSAVAAFPSASPTVSLRFPGLAFDGSPEPLPTPTPTPAPPPKPASIEGLRIWSDGDSTSYFMTLALFAIASDRGAVPARAADYKISSGLQNTVFFDWRSYVAAEMALYDPDVAVFMVGANDAMQIRSYEDYAARVGAIMDLMNRPGRRVLWLGQPNMRPNPALGYNPALADAIAPLNQVFIAEAAKRPWVTYVDCYALTSFSEGSFADSLPDDDGIERELRAADGIHFTSAGGRRLALGALAALTK